ncbi:MAG: adenosine deaminase [Candidatus Baltobacteraceae bacterium]
MDEFQRYVERIPKIHLHCHLEGSLRAQTFLELTERDGISTRYRPGEDVAGPRDLDRVYAFADFQEFLLTFAAVSRALATPADYARLAREFVDDARAQRVVYGELFISPSVWAFFHPRLDLGEAVSAIAGELKAADGAEFRLIVDVTRNFGAESAMRTTLLASQLEDHGVIGVGLGGDEARFPADLFEDVFAFARSQGLHCVAHAGEAAGAESVRAAIDILRAERIGHGVRALEDPSVVELLRERKIALEVCPTSNFLTGTTSRERPHPLQDLDAAGVCVTIDADDPALFETSITGEYLYAARNVGVDALNRFILNAVDASFLDRESKQALRGRISAELRAAGANALGDVRA